MNFSSSEFIDIKKLPTGISTELNIQKVIDRIPKGKGKGGGAAASVLWAEVIVAVADCVPEAPSGSPEYAGINYYIVRLLTSNFAEFDPEHTPYTLDTQVIDPTDGRLYTVTADPVVTNMELEPHENLAEWEISEEIKIEFAWGLDGTTPVNLKNVVPRHAVGAIVKIVSRTVGATTRYYLDAGCQNIGEYADRSITIIDGVMHACWRAS
jgi:hypothetical protein